MAEHNFNVMGEDLCQFCDDSGAQNEADDDNNNFILAEQQPHHSSDAVIISPPPCKRPRPKKSKVHMKTNIKGKSLDDLVDDYDKYLEEESAHDLCFSERGFGSCTCLHILRKAHPRRMVAKYLAGMAMKSKTDKDCKEAAVLEWYKYVS